MAAKARNNLAPRQETSAQAYAGVSRNKMRADWDQVRQMLVSGERKAKDGRHLFEVWADTVLANPAVEYERAMRLCGGGEEAAPQQQLNVQSLYLMALQGVQKRGDEAKLVEGTIRVEPDASAW